MPLWIYHSHHWFIVLSPIRGPRLCQSIAKQHCPGQNTKIGATKASWLTEVPFLHTGNLAFSYHAGLHGPKNFATAKLWMACVGTDHWLQWVAANRCHGIHKRSLLRHSPLARILYLYVFETAAIHSAYDQQKIITKLLAHMPHIITV